MYYYEVAPFSIVRAESATFTYASASILSVGQFVTIPVGKKTLTGLVMQSVKNPPYATKQIFDALEIPALPIELVTTAQWMAHYYATHLAIVLQTVLPRGIAKKRRVRANIPSMSKRERTNIVFTKSQEKAIRELSTMPPGTALLHGITGSGKTAVYIELCRRSLDAGASTIILVPEIALTSQLVAELSQHFNNLYVTHSKQTEAERHSIWQAIAISSKPCVVVGPRSALFMPVQKLGLIVIDEAHEPSFKQEQAPRYSALRVASILGKAHGARVIQGSATPLISEYYIAEHTHQRIVSMPDKARIDTTEPEVSLIDMTKRHHFTKHRHFSQELLGAIERNLANGDQSLIFHNRRGSASTTLCESCGWAAVCPRCFVPFTLHSDYHTLRCHVCGLEDIVPTSCPVCHSTDVIHKGIGTKLIESELSKLFPKAVIARFDGDTAEVDTVEQRYQELYDGTIDIIIGTQVIAKGLDLPHLRLVGVVQADAGLALPDFAASERTFQLLAQVVGRVGRSSHPTTVIVQSYQPTASAVQQGLAQDYTAFYHDALTLRRQGNFPPLVYLLKLTCVYKTETAAVRNARLLAIALRQQHPDVTVLGPTPAFYERQRDSYRWQLVVKSSSRARLLDILHSVPSAHWQADLDPASLL
jgi:primosomal protein N' (replication factor Y)